MRIVVIEFCREVTLLVNSIPSEGFRRRSEPVTTYRSMGLSDKPGENLGSSI